MNAELFAKYVPAINSFLTADKDSTFKGWNELVTIFFAMNADERVSSKTQLAYAFDNADHPSYIRIQVASIAGYFDTFEISAMSLQQEGFAESKDYIRDDQGTRITFNVFRALVFTKGDRELIDSYTFIESVRLIHQRYNIEMIGRAKNATHWTLIERINGFTAAMKTEGEQWKVYIVVRGSVKSIDAKLRKYANETKKDPLTAKHATEPSSPVYQAMMTNLDEEIHAVISYLAEKHVDISTALKINKAYLMIDQSQTGYAIENLVNDINIARSRIQFGEKTHDKPMSVKKYAKQTKKDPNIVDIDMFVETNGQYIDKKKMIPLSAPRVQDQVSALTERVAEMEIEDTAPMGIEPTTPVEILSATPMEVEQEDPPVIEPPKRVKAERKPISRAPTKRARA